MEPQRSPLSVPACVVGLNYPLHAPDLAFGHLREELARVVRLSTGCRIAESYAAIDPALRGIWDRATHETFPSVTA